MGAVPQPIERISAPPRRVWVEIRLAGAPLERRPLVELARLQMDQLTPVTQIPAYRGRRGHQGYWWLSSVGHSVEFSTLTEADLLVQLDYSNRYAGFVHSPMRLLWKSNGAKTSQRVVPSYLGWMPDGSADLVFSGPLPHPAVLETLTEQTGIQVRSRLADETFMTNLRWLAAFRFTTCRPDLDARDAIRKAVERDGRFQAVRRAVSAELGVQPEAVSTWICSMLWHRELRTPLDREMLRGKSPLEVSP